MKKELIKSELESIARKHGALLRPLDVVKFAENPKTALHSCFTWDNTEAAEQWRLHEARMLIRVIVNIVPMEDGDREYRAYVSLKDDRQAGMGYRTMLSILSDDDLKEQMLQDAMEELEAFKAKYAELKELCEVFEAIEKVKTKTKRLPVLSKRRAEARA